MKYLFKNSFFSFLKNKTGVFLLMFIVFLTSASFTMFNSANNSFKRSYDSVMENGQRHDYTIKELYDLSGQANFATPEKVTGANAIYTQTEITPKAGVSSAIPAKGHAGMLEKDGENFFTISTTANDTYAGDKDILVYIKTEDALKYVSGTTTSLPAHAYYDLSFGDPIADDGSTSTPSGEIDFDLATNPVMTFQYGGYKSDFTIDASAIGLVTQPAFDSNFESANVQYQNWILPIDTTSKEVFKEAYKDIDNAFSLKVSDGSNFNAASFTYKGNLGTVPSYAKLQEASEQKIYSNAEQIMHNNILKTLDEFNKVENKVEYKDVDSMKVTIGTNLFKAVKETNSKVDSMKIYEGSTVEESLKYDALKANFISGLEQKSTDLQAKMMALMMDATDPNNFAKSQAIAAEKKELEGAIKSIKNGNGDVQYDGYKVYWSNFKGTYSLVDSTSYQAVISPSYASRNKIKPISKSKLTDILNNKELKEKMNDPNISFTEVKATMQKVASQNDASKALVFVGSTPVFVTGIGITPDFAFPIISQDVAIPNSNNQAIIYLNNAGYNRIKDANPGSDTENYVALRFTDKATDADRSAVIAKVNKFADDFMSWPKGINALEAYDSTTESVLMAPTRMTFLNTISGAVSKITWIVTSLLLAFASFIVVLVIRKQIDTRKKELGILMANGYSRSQVSASMMMLSIMVVVIPAAVGYITGHFFQFILISIFNDYWTLPVWDTQWSWLTFTLIIGLPLIGLSLIAFLISLLSLKGTIPEILTGASVSKAGMMNGVSRSIKFLGIKSKMAISTTISNIGKITIGMVAFTATLISLSISFNSVDKFGVASTRSQAARAYKYEVDLVTPTDEGGLYSRQTLDSIYYDSQSINGEKDGAGVQHNVHSIRPVRKVADILAYKGILDDFNSVDSGGNPVASFDNALSFHSPSGSDATFAWSPVNAAMPYVDYLKNRIQIKSLLDTNVTGKINPWQIASQMMPENQRNKAELASTEFINQVGEWIDRDDHAYLEQLKTDNIIYRNTLLNKWEINRNNTIDGGKTALKDTYKNFIVYGMIRSSQEYYLGNKDVHIPLMLSYHSIITDNTDETYTHVDIKTHLKDIKGNDERKELRIRGIDLDLLKSGKSMIKLSKDSINSLEADNTLTNYTPIVINKYVSEYYKLNNGSIIDAVVGNASDRYKVKAANNQKFKVVGIEDTYDDGRIYTLKSYANKALGLDALLNSNTLVKSSKEIFNGVFSKEENPVIFRTSPIYAESGLYLGKNTTDMKSGSQDKQYQMIEQKYFGPMSGIIPQFTFPNPLVKSIDDIKSIYGVGEYLHPLNSAYNAVEAANISAYQFNSIMELSSALMNTIQAITMIISLAFVLLIATMIIADNKKFISTLKVMGYRNREISRIFISTFIPALIVAVVIALPLSFGILELIRIGIMNFGHVLIPLHMMGWEMVAAFGVLILGLGTMWWISSRGLKNTSLLQAFNE